MDGYCNRRGYGGFFCGMRRGRCWQCGIQASKAAASQAAASSSQPAQSSQAEVKYENSLKGLQQYMTAKGVAEGEPISMEAGLIGAKEGVRYRGSFEGKDNITLELYRYDPSDQNEAAQKVLADVKEKGTFTIMEKQVPATLNGDYLMVYSDTQTGEVHEKRADEVKQIFLNFQK